VKGEVVLVKPLNDLGVSPIPLGLLHVGTSLEAKGYKVKIVDANKDPNYKDTLGRKLNKALYVGITCLTTEVKNALEISDYIREKSDTPIVWGGWHPTLFPLQTCADESVDFVCLNEGDDTAVRLAETLEADSSPENIEGLAYKTDGKVKMNPPRKYVDIEKLPLTNYDLVDLSQYNISGNIRKQRVLPYQSSRGCPHRCGFCINTVACNNVWRAKSAKKTVDEIEVLIRKYNLDYIGFLDDNFFVSKQRVVDICREMIARKLDVEWMAESRADYFDRFDHAFLELMVKSGLVQLNIGAESGSPRILSLLDKDITVEQVLKSATMLSGYPVTPVYCFMLGIPTETDIDIRSTVALAEKIRKICPRAEYRMAVLTPYPRCKLTDRLIAMGLFKEPASLREWASDDIRELYTDRFAGKPWHSNPRLLENLSYFSGLAYETYSDELIRMCIKNFDVLKFPNIFFIFMSRLRMRLHCYGVPIDKSLNTLMKRYFKKHVPEGKYGRLYARS
jgi:anaerobic magnesium-protoporphyrin IX monomethyl ester cyclase